jgi:hypothetical protein
MPAIGRNQSIRLTALSVLSYRHSKGLLVLLTLADAQTASINIGQAASTPNYG